MADTLIVATRVHDIGLGTSMLCVSHAIPVYYYFAPTYFAKVVAVIFEPRLCSTLSLGFVLTRLPHLVNTSGKDSLLLRSPLSTFPDAFLEIPSTTHHAWNQRDLFARP